VGISLHFQLNICLYYITVLAFRVFFTYFHQRNLRLSLILLLGCGLASTSLVQAQTDNSSPSATNAIAVTAPIPAGGVSTNAPSGTPTLTSPDVTAESASLPPPTVSSLASPSAPAKAVSESNAPSSDAAGWPVLAALVTLASLGGFLLYYCGLTRAKNCGQTSTLLLVGIVFGWIGYWMGGFAVQTGGVGDSHAALTGTISAAARNALDHELGFMAGGHYWGLMGSSGFFLTTDAGNASGIALLFLIQAALVTIVIAAALGAALERGKVAALAIGAFVIGTLIYPVLANWVWGGGWLAELGHDYGLGHGYVDLAGAGVVHETAGVLALVIAVTLGPRYGRFGREKIARAIPGHNLPFVVLGASILLISWMATNVLTSGTSTDSTPLAGLAAVNTLLAAAGGLMISFFVGNWQRQRPDPARLCRGLLGGAVASSACSALIDPWAAFVIGGVAALFVQGAVTFLEWRRIDDPVGAAATHGAGGAWGVLATGLFANGLAGQGINGIDGGVRGLFFGGSWHQLAAQAIGVVTGFVVVFILGYVFLLLIQKIVGARVGLEDETGGLDWPQIGALGYQGDIEPDFKE